MADKYYFVSPIPEIIKNVKTFDVIYCKHVNDKFLALLSIDDKHIDELQKYIAGSEWNIFGNDGYRYVCTTDNLTKTNMLFAASENDTIKKLKNSVKQTINASYRQYKDEKSCLYLNQDAIVKDKITFKYRSFKRFMYCDIETKCCYHFRFHAADGDGVYPLVVFLHGAGGRGYDKQANYLYKPIRLKSKKCFILAQQLGLNEQYNTNFHHNALNKIIDKLIENNQRIDINRIYIVGFSYGAYGALYEVLRNPEKYAAAVSIAGEFIIEETQEQNPFNESDYFHLNLNNDMWETISKTPFYFAHSSDDNDNLVVSSDVAVKNILDAGGEAKYYRLSEGGHAIYRITLKNSDCIEWMFLKKRS